MRSSVRIVSGLRSHARSFRPVALGVLGILVSALLLAGCGSGGGSSVSSGGPVGGGDPGGGSGGSFASTAIVTNRGTPQAGVMVTLSRGTDASGNPSNVIATVPTDDQGRAVFTGLTEGALHCYSATIASENRRFCSNRDERTVRLTFGEL
jgi:hypothetical protein